MWQAYFDACHLHDLCKKQNHGSVLILGDQTRKEAVARMDDEILKGYPISDFLQSEKCAGWNPDTRRYYTNCLQDLLAFTRQHGEPTEQLLTDWVNHLKQTYGCKTVNVHIAAANQYFRWCGRLELLREHIKSETTTDPPTPTVTRAEYLKLLRAARALGKQRTYLLVKLFATTDLPLQCLDQVTAEIVKAGQGTLDYHGVTIDFRCPPPLQRELLDYMARNGVYRGPVFVTRNNRPISRIAVFKSMQELCSAAGVPEEKGNPRSFRNLYKATQQELDDRVAVLKNQMYDQMIEMEQAAVGWPAEDTAAGRSA